MCSYTDPQKCHCAWFQTHAHQQASLEAFPASGEDLKQKEADIEKKKAERDEAEEAMKKKKEDLEEAGELKQKKADEHDSAEAET